MPARAGCPDPGHIAARAELRLTGEEATRMDAHLASCPDCAEVFAETVRFWLEEQAEAGAVPSSGTPLPFFRRRAIQVVAALAVAAGLVLASWLAWQGISRPVAEPLVAELSKAMGEQRFVEPRLTGGFRHAPLVVLRGERPRGLDAYPPPVLSAVARIRQRAEADPSPKALGALGVTYLVSGDVAAAVKALESATAQAPDDARLLSDLAAVYLVRATRLDEPADFPKALDAAEKAIVVEDAPDEAWFNRALALEQLHLVDAARKAWQEYLERDSTSGWADEARRHLAALPEARQSSTDDDRARVRAALQEGPAAVDRLADAEPSLLRDYFQNELLPGWAEAQLAGRGPEAAALTHQAVLMGDSLRRATGDALVQDTARALAPGPAAASRAALRLAATGYRALREGQVLYDLEQPSCAVFREGSRLLEAGNSPYAARAREQSVNACLYPGDPERGMHELGRIAAVCEQRGYAWLLARVRWLQGLFQAHIGEHTASLERFRQARDGYRSLGDTENEATMHVLIAESLRLLGEGSSGWQERKTGLAMLERLRTQRGRRRTLAEAVVACQEQNLPRTALHFQTALIETTKRWSSAAAMSDALLTRSATLQSLGYPDRALLDVAAARRLVPRIGDGGLREEMTAEADAAEGAILADRQPEQAAASLEGALGYFERTAPARAPGIHELLARAQLARDLDDEAERHLEEGIRELELQRLSLRDVPLQVSFFDRAVPLFDEMVGLQVERRHDPERALAFVERGRARQLQDSISGRSAGKTSSGAPAQAPLEPGELRQELPDGVALVYLVSRQTRVLSWALSRGASLFEERPLPADELRRLVAQQEAALLGRASLPVLREASARLYEALVRPLAPVLRSQRAIVLVPDGVLQSVAFACLWDRQTGRYLIEDHLVGMAPSGTVFVRASEVAGAMPHDRNPSALVIGNPRLDRDLETDLPNLPGAEAEATEVARLYVRSVLLTGSGATKREFLDRTRTSDVVHFAGHAVDGDAGWGAHLLFAADPARRERGALYLHELDGRVFPRTRVVVLAACRTAAGTLSRLEGTWSLVRPFLASGVPTVVASLWDVDDAASSGFFVAFHRAFLAEGDALIALRRTQIALLRDSNPLLAHPASWAGFVSIGGLNPRGLDRVPPPPVSSPL